ncbi:MAG: MTH1187 family thiamine-binding protein [Armatimonadetes bacterium]|nr:MTH1187 family thiamine-binding protein [Armatimonadota bacterium]MDW8123021.1 MTH1187 family thiamine-binding protein [Armatimonadota bacterium]
MKVVAEVSLVPIGTGETGVSSFVAAAIRALTEVAEKNDLAFQVGAMATTIEGPLEGVWQAIRAMQEAVFQAGAARVITTLRIDDRRDKEESIQRKIAVVAEKGVPVERKAKGAGPAN